MTKECRSSQTRFHPRYSVILHAHEYGPPHAPALFILHGFLGSADNWHTLASRWSATHRVFALDARNHGRSPHEDQFSHALMAHDVLAFADHHGIERFSLLGHSMGGRTAMEIAVHHGERVEHLLIVDIAPRTYPSHHEHIFEALNAVDLACATDRQTVERQLAQLIDDFGIRQFLMKNLHREQTGQYRWKMNLPVLEREYHEVVKGLPTGTQYSGPTLVIRGSRARYVTDEDILLFQEHFPKVRVVTLDAGHWVHAERPEEVFQSVSRFLTGSERTF